MEGEIQVLRLTRALKVLEIYSLYEESITRFSESSDVRKWEDSYNGGRV